MDMGCCYSEFQLPDVESIELEETEKVVFVCVCVCV